MSSEPETLCQTCLYGCVVITKDVEVEEGSESWQKDREKVLYSVRSFCSNPSIAGHDDVTIFSTIVSSCEGHEKRPVP